jgi:hypothetical protein
MFLASATVGEALTPGKYVCQLSGGNSIVVTLQIAQQAVLKEGSVFVPVFSAVGEWDDASLSPRIPVYGSILVDPQFDIVGGLTQVSWNTPSDALEGAPFGVLPVGIHVQFNLTESGTEFGIARIPKVLSGKWADDTGRFGLMSCAPTK